VQGVTGSPSSSSCVGWDALFASRLSRFRLFALSCAFPRDISAPRACGWLDVPTPKKQPFAPLRAEGRMGCLADHRAIIVGENLCLQAREAAWRVCVRARVSPVVMDVTHEGYIDVSLTSTHYMPRRNDSAVREVRCSGAALEH
jgi:hypothetical protein